MNVSIGILNRTVWHARWLLPRAATLLLACLLLLTTGAESRAATPHALSFATGSRVDLAQTVTLTGDFTVSYWFATGRDTNWRVINNSSSLNYSIGHWTTSRIGLWNPSLNIDLNQSFVTSQWEHIAVTRSGNTIRVYRSGIDVGSGTWGSGEKQIRIDRIGGLSGNTSWSGYAGSAAEVRVWDHARSAAAIADDMTLRLTGSESGLLHYWPIDEGEGTTIHDRTANANHGTLTLSTGNWTTDGPPMIMLDLAMEHPVTGSRDFTGQLDINVVLGVPEDFEPAAYIVSDTLDEQPAIEHPDWSATEPTGYTFDTATEGETLILYAWLKDAEDVIIGAPASIVYTTATPEAAARNTTLYGLEGFSFTGAAIDDGSTGGTLADETPIPIHALLLHVGTDEPAESLTLALGTHTVTLTVVNAAGNTATDTAEVEIVEGVLLSLHNPETGSADFVNADTVDLAITIATADGVTLEYAINATGDDSALAWSATEPATFTFDTPQDAETQTAYLWVRDQAEPGTVVSTNASIVYTETTPVMSVVADFTVGVASGQQIVITPAYLDDGSTGGEVNSIPIGIHDMGVAVGAGAPQESVTLSTTDPAGETFTLTLTVTNAAGNTATDTVDVTLELAASTDNLTWSGGGTTETWAESANWAGGLRPANPTPGTLFFTDDDLSDTVAKLLTPISDWYGLTPTNTWRIGSLRTQNVSGEHIVDLGGGTLDIAGELRTQRATSPGTARMTLQNGILQVGSNIHTDYGVLTLRDLDAPVVLSSATADIIVNRGGMIVTNAALPSRFRNLKIGMQNTTTVDMRGGQFADGLLDVDNFEMSVGAEPKSLFYLDGDTLHTIKVRNNFWFVYNGKRTGARIGAPDPDRGNQWFLPYGVNIYIGEEGARGNFIVGREHDYYQTSDITRLAVSGGGEFEAWVNTFLVGLTGAGHGSHTYVTLDLRGMDAFFMDANTATVGESTGSRGIEARAYLPAGTARFGSLKCGTDVGTTRITELELWGTHVAIDTKLELLDSALIVVRVGETSSGLDLAADIDLDITGNPEIRILFTEEPDGSEAHHWGLRRAGDHAALLGNLYEQDIITMAMDFGESESYRAAVYYDETSGYTYAGLLDADASLPPALIAADITVEVGAGMNTVRIGPDDLLAALSNPDDLEILDRTLSHPSIAGGDELAYIDFPTDSLPVTYASVTLKYVFDGYTASDTGDVTFVPAAATTGGNVIWLGDAGLQHDARRAWEWGANWEAGQSPANPAATVAFADNDLDAALPPRLGPIPDWEGTTPTNAWTIASLRAGNSSGTHVLELEGQTLRTTGQVLASRLTPTGSGDLVISNGTLEVGTDLTVQNGSGIDLSGMGGTLLSIGRKLVVRSSTLTLDGGVVLDGRFEGLEVAYGGSHSALDLRGTTVDGGILDLDEIRIGGNNRNGTLYLDTNTLHTLRIRNLAHFNGQGQRGGALIGAQDPTRGNAWYLPADIDVLIGSEASPAEMIIGLTSGYADGSVCRVAGHGDGIFEAWLTTLIVGQATGSHQTARLGTLDVRDMRELFLSAPTVSIGVGDAARTPKGDVYLGPGTAIVGDLTVGHENANASSIARLELNDTQLSVTNSLTAFAHAELTANVRANRASGFELPALPSMPDGATMTITFEADPAHGDLHYGLKISGDVADALQDALVVDPQDPQPGQWLIVDDDALTGNETTIFTSAGDTYVGIPPPAGSLFLLR